MKLLALLGISLMGYSGFEIYISSLDATHAEPRRWCDAWMCPQEFSDRRLFDLLRQSAADNSPAALTELRRALLLNSASTYNWVDLGDAEMNAKHADIARYCFQQAVAAAPLNPLILFRAANFDFQASDSQGTLQLLKIVLNEGGSSYFEPAFLIYSRLDLPVPDILEGGIPKSQKVAGEYLKSWITANKVTEAEATWEWMSKNGLTSTELASEYVSFLMKNEAFDLAASTWKEAEKRDVPEYRNTNWVFDGDFRQEPTQSPLDWTLDKIKGVEIERSSNGGRDGKSALKLNFLGTENVDFRSVSQTLILRPGHWIFKTWIKTDAITTNQGISVHLSDLNNGQYLNWFSPAIAGSNDWTCIEKTFEIAKTVTPVRIDFVRQPSRKFDNKIEGTVWLDNVTVSPILP